jgi:hypothetical protein
VKLKAKADAAAGPIHESKAVTYGGRKELTMSRTDRTGPVLTVRQGVGGKGYQVFEGDARAAGSGRGVRELGSFDSLGAAKKFGKERLAKGPQAEPAKPSRPSKEERRTRILEKAGEQVSGNREGKFDKRDADGKRRPAYASDRDTKAERIKKARKVIAKVDTKQQAKLADQKARAEKRRAQQPRLDLTKGDRAPAVNRMVAKSKAAAEAKSASRKAPTTASNVADRVAAARAKQKADVQKTMAGRAVNAPSGVKTPTKPAPKPVARDRPGEREARWRSSGIQAQRVGGKGLKAGGVEKATMKADAKPARANVLKRLTSRSRLASDKAGARDAVNRRANAETVARNARIAAREAARREKRARAAAKAAARRARA